MTTRRTFFARLAQAAAIVALAPRLAFRVPDEAIEIERDVETLHYIFPRPQRIAWHYSDDYLKALESQVGIFIPASHHDLAREKDMVDSFFFGKRVEAPFNQWGST